MMKFKCLLMIGKLFISYVLLSADNYHNSNCNLILLKDACNDIIFSH